jgi:Zn-finger nucleic acid-binding protein
MQMTKVVAHTLVIDRCPACHGAWLDGGELERLRDDVARDSMIAIARGALGAS